MAILAFPNTNEKTFTIKKFDDSDNVYMIYKTYPLSDAEFEELEYNTENDWKNFLRTNDVYAVYES